MTFDLGPGSKVKKAIFGNNSKAMRDRDHSYIVLIYKKIRYTLSFDEILIAMIGTVITSSIAQSFYNQCKIARVAIIIWKQARKLALVLSIIKYTFSLRTHYILSTFSEDF